jgi:hypothetical protein
MHCTQFLESIIAALQQMFAVQHRRYQNDTAVIYLATERLMTRRIKIKVCCTTTQRKLIFKFNLTSVILPLVIQIHI